MIDAVAAAADAVAFATPFLIEAGKAGASKIGESATSKLLAWLGEKTTGRTRQALSDLESEPTSPGYQAVLREQLAKLLEQDPSLLAQLSGLLPAQPVAGDRMEQHVEGAGAKGSQIKGSGNTVTM